MSLMICYPVRPLVKQSEAMVLRFQCVFLKLLFKYNCLHFHITTHPCHTHSCFPPSNLPPSPFGFVHVSFIHVPWWSFLYYPSPPSSLDTVNLFFISMLCLYLACLFVLMIRFHLQVRSYGICLSPPGLFHLAECSPVPSMLLRRVGVPPFFLLSSIPLCKCTPVFLSTHLLMDI